MKYKLVASDIDGTLLNDKEEISLPVRRAIKAIQEQGIVFTLSTGRSIKGIGRYLDLFSADAPVITYNGALITTALSREVIFKSEMPRSAADILIERGIAEGAIVAVWTNDTLYCSDTNSTYCDFYRSISDVETHHISVLPDADVTKIVWLLPSEKVIYLQNNYSPPEGVQSKSSGTNLLEFFSCSAGKDKALLFLAKHLGIDIAEIITIGDNYNDMAMLQTAGLGIAMRNAPDEVKKAADYITVSNNEDGVAQAIERFILNPSYGI